jgi:hypothetical protein
LGDTALIEALGTITTILFAIQAAALIVLHAAPTGYDPIRDAVSDYGVGRYRGGFWVQVVAGGLGSLLLAIALSRLYPFTPMQAVVALLVTAAARLLIPFFPTDQGAGRFQTARGALHMVLAVLAFGGLIWAAMGLWTTLSHYPAWHGDESLLTIVPWVMLGSAVAVVLAIRGRRVNAFFGLFERLFYLSAFVWLFTVTVGLSRIPG